MNRQDIIDHFPIVAELERRGIETQRRGMEVVCCCPLHEDRNPSFRVNEAKGVWRCDPCDVGGSVIDLVAKLDGLSIAETMKRLGGDEETPRPAPLPPVKSQKIVKTYVYADETGEPVYEVCRMEPKTFRQRHKVNGEWVWSMEGVRRVLYNLPAVLKADMIWIVEGEKDADTLSTLGLCATCNVGGAGKWDDGYTASLKDKDVVLCGDSDEPGQKHVAKVLQSLTGHVRTTRQIRVPQPYKDVSEWMASGADPAALFDLAAAAEVLTRGVKLPLKNMAELEREYRYFIANASVMSLWLGEWLPSTREDVRPLVPGELVVFVAGTGVGKTMLLQNLALHTPLITLMFELELPGTLSFERFAAMATRQGGDKVAAAYRTNQGVNWKATGRLDHIYVCSESKMSAQELERIIQNASLKTGIRPTLVLVDYIQLMQGQGDRRERVSDAAEELKIVAKATNTIIVMASQIARKEKPNGEVFLCDAKESGSIENSAGLVIGAWRDESVKGRMWLKVMKNTKGVSGRKIACDIKEGLIIEEADPQPKT